MGFFNNFPYTNFHEMNLDWLINAFNELKSYVEQYTAVNNVSYGGIWDIAKQYTQWCIVSYNNSSYISIKPVPVGIEIDNTEYWTELASLDPRYAELVVAIGNIEKEIGNNKKEIGNIEKAISALKGKVVYGFDSVETMMGNDLEAGVIAICAKRNGYDVVTIWEIGAEQKDICSVALTNGLYANYVKQNEMENVLGLGVKKYPESCTDRVNALLAGDYNKLYFPEGKYKLSVTVTNTVQISGSNQTQFSPEHGEFESDYDTIFTQDGAPVFTIDARGGSITNCKFSNFEIVGDDSTNKANDGIRTIGDNDTEFVDFCLFDNILIRNCYRGVSWGSRGIWNTFNGVRFYGNHGSGLSIAPPDICAFNHNSFNDCQFAHNKKRGIEMYSSGVGYKNNTNYFNHCNIEVNQEDWVDAPESFAVFVINCHGIVFADCYIEANKGTATVWLNASDATFISGCSLIPTTPFVGSVKGSKCLIVGMHGHNTEATELCTSGTEAGSVCVIGRANLNYLTNNGTPEILW